jgi:hypothetical protein
MPSYNWLKLIHGLFVASYESNHLRTDNARSYLPKQISNKNHHRYCFSYGQLSFRIETTQIENKAGWMRPPKQYATGWTAVSGLLINDDFLLVSKVESKLSRSQLQTTWEIWEIFQTKLEGKLILSHLLKHVE